MIYFYDVILIIYINNEINVRMIYCHYITLYVIQSIDSLTLYELKQSFLIIFSDSVNVNR